MVDLLLAQRLRLHTTLDGRFSVCVVVVSHISSLVQKLPCGPVVTKQVCVCFVFVFPQYLELDEDQNGMLSKRELVNFGESIKVWMDIQRKIYIHIYFCGWYLMIRSRNDAKSRARSRAKKARLSPFFYAPYPPTLLVDGIPACSGLSCLNNKTTIVGTITRVYTQ